MNILLLGSGGREHALQAGDRVEAFELDAQRFIGELHTELAVRALHTAYGLDAD